ncbi:beta-galactosidase GalB [Mangrovimonas sp. YM274]|uniref:beta-galactosidase GalB n=1 Tax=Mangrovimonas sp. YM274 TaxID=3070660 RepID=UPI0027DDC3CA|nr:beta-galactosidase GalB [Mangrovimonas sp. YM274]WMI68296.1 beta-galactosidase GalB [Mangrovimonas sp. YM274]
MRNFFSLKSISVFITILFIATSCQSPKTSGDTTQREVNFSNNWQFYLAGNASDSISEHTNWRTLNVPHDWSIEGEFKKDHPADLGGGYLPGGLGWYKKTFTVEDANKMTIIHFDGVYMDSDVWINGHHVGNRPNGYIGFEYDLTPYLKYNGQENEILVKVDNSKQPNSRWYSGSGIYRNVWLKTIDKLHVDTWGTFITTPNVSTEEAETVLEINLKNDYAEAQEATVITSIYKGNVQVGTATASASINANDSKTITQNITVEQPQLWSVEHPEMYTAKTEVQVAGQTVDEYTTPFGIRTFEFDLDKGFLLNGEQVKIKGVCNHHDLGPLGSAVNTRALERQLQIMKDMGVNGIRTAHNPPTPELLELCDTMGFIVMDEMFDMWNNTKSPHDYANYWKEWHQKDLEDFIIRDRNHPSIFMWSVGNEIQEQWNEQGVITAKELKAIVRKLDTTRPITVAMNPPVNMPNADVTTQFDVEKASLNPVAASGVLDLIGYNYAHNTFPFHQQNFPETPFIATETTSGLQTRGYYDKKSDTLKRWPVRWDLPFDGGNPGNTVSAYDQVSTPWGSTHEETWKIIKKYDFLSGMYIWTGFDYIGEPTPYVWPSRSSYFGIVDLAGFPKDVYYMYQSEWTDKDVLHIFPHWNWTEGETVDVWAYYNNADEVELFVNGKSQGIKKKEGDDLHVMWRIPFEAGTVKAVSRKDGQVVLEKELKTAGEAATVKLTADRQTITADGKDLSFITVDVVDADGNFVATAQNQLNFSIEGNGEIFAVGNGDPTNHESFKGKTHKALNGKCLVVVKSTDKAGIATLKVSSDGLKEATITVTTK